MAEVKGNAVKVLRQNIGTIVAFLGFTMLCVLTFGDLGEIASDAYWENVKNNILSISIMSISLTLIQVVIKQGVGEQALQKGMNSAETTQAIDKHREAIKSCQDRMIYLPYFLQIYNKRHTIIKRQEFIVDNDLVNEKTLLASGNKKMIRKYNSVCIHITAHRIKWTTTEIVHDKQGQIETLQEYRIKRAIHGIISSAIFMIGMTFLTKGLFFSPSQEPLWQKFVKLFCYVISIGIGSITQVIKEYEKGRFSVPNELDEINEIWQEFKDWNIPDWIKADVESYNDKGEEVTYGKVKPIKKQRIDSRRDIQEKPLQSESVSEDSTDSVLSSTDSVNNILLSNGSELNR